jgi:orotate phosphoribosyltransferase
MRSLMDADRNRLLAVFVRQGLRIGEGVTPSGRAAGWTLDLRDPLMDANTLQLASCVMWNLVRSFTPTRIGGLAMSAIPLVAAMLSRATADFAFELGARWLLRAAGDQAHGLRRQVEGQLPGPHDRVVLVDDILNSGTAMGTVLDALGPTGARVVAAVVLVDFHRRGRVRLEAQGIPVHAVFAGHELGLHRLGTAVPIIPQSVIHLGRHPVPHGPVGTVVAVAGNLLGISRRGHPTWATPMDGVCPVCSTGQLTVATAGGDELVGVDRATGNVRWRRQCESLLLGAPVISQNTVVVAGRGAAGHGGLAGLHVRTGDVKWRSATEGVPVACALLDRAQWVACGDSLGVLTVVDPLTGSAGSSHRLPAPICAVAGDAHELSAYASLQDGTLAAVSDHSLRWVCPVGRVGRAGSVVIGDIVVAAGDRHVVARQRDDGAPRWVIPLAAAKVHVAATPRGAIAALGDDGILAIVDPAAGRIQALFDTGLSARGISFLEQLTLVHTDDAVVAYDVTGPRDEPTDTGWASESS